MNAEETRLSLPMRIMGGVILLFSVIEFGVGGAAYGVAMVHLGGWWGGIISFIAGGFGLSSYNRCIVITGCIFAVIGIVIALIAAIIDGALATGLNEIEACYNTDSNEYYGDSASFSNALACATLSSGDDDFFYGSSNSQCVCYGSSTCSGYNLSSGSDCAVLYTTWYRELATSSAFLSSICVLCLVYSILACVACCAPADQQQPAVINAASPQLVTPVQYSHAPQPVFVAGQQPQQVIYAGQPTVVMYAPVGQPTVYPQPGYQPGYAPQHQPVAGGATYAYQPQADQSYAVAQPLPVEPQNAKY